MTSDTSMMGAIGQAMGNAAQGAMLGYTIGQLRDEASNAIALANGWHDYAKRLELQVSQLQGTVQSLAGTAKEKIAEVADLKLERIRTNEKLAKSQLNKQFNSATSDANQAYGKQFKFRLRQMEKALKHSSGDKEAMRSILKVYEEVIERLNLTGELPDDLKKTAESIREKFMNGENLTADDDVQAIIDEAPVPKAQGPANF